MKALSVGKALLPGESVEVPHPFIREAYSANDGEGQWVERIGWRPGVRNVPLRDGDAETVADGMGAQILTMVGRYRPGKFPERVFYTRKWRDPDGHVFGKSNLHTKTLGNFNSMVQGYRHRFRVVRREMESGSAAEACEVQHGR